MATNVEKIIHYFENNDMPEFAEAVRKLQDRSNELSALEYAGVDNWNGYSYKWDMLEEYFPETHERLTE